MLNIYKSTIIILEKCLFAHSGNNIYIVNKCLSINKCQSAQPLKSLRMTAEDLCRIVHINTSVQNFF